ncbi:hypothetical protein [Leadbetterella sp. DM7]|uniref:hypothetical protein n=1 Tax=Leadbetterella sp. DM7 TaxID=3235085 RepID=UPI00349EAC64
MSIQKITESIAGLVKKCMLVALVCAATSSCGIKGDEPKPGTEPGSTKATVVDFQERGAGGYVYTKDSLVVLYAKGAEFVVSVRQADLKKGNNIKINAPGLRESNIKGVNNGAMVLEDYNMNTEMSALDKTYLGSSGQDKLKNVKLINNGLWSVRADANDDAWRSITKAQVVGIIKLLEQPVALVGHTAMVNGKTYTLMPTN